MQRPTQVADTAFPLAGEVFQVAEMVVRLVGNLIRFEKICGSSIPGSGKTIQFSKVEIQSSRISLLEQTQFAEVGRPIGIEPGAYRPERGVYPSSCTEGAPPSL